MPAQPKGGNVVIDDKMRQKWWDLHMGGYTIQVIKKRFGVSATLVSVYLKERRAAEGVEAPPRNDTVSLVTKLKGKISS